jgi:putative membrane protein
MQTRRAALLSFAAAAATSVLIQAGASLAQTAPAESTGEQSDYVMQTLMAGMLSLQMSEVAMEKARDPLVQEFAQLEIGEQQAMASVLSATQTEPPVLSQSQVARVSALSNMDAGPDFDMAYVDEQIVAHEELLQIQRTLSQETEATVEAVTARLAEAAILSHLAMLNHMRLHLLDGAEIVQPADAEAPAAPVEGAAPAEPSVSPTPADRPVEGAAPEASEQPELPTAPAS